MACVSWPEGLEAESGDQVQCLNATPSGAPTVLRHVNTGDILFRAGDRRTLYRVERGAICHYVLWTDGRHDVIEFAFPGDIIGLGHLSAHSTTAQAMVDTLVSIVSDEELEEALENDDRLSFRMASAVEREFDYVRDRTLKAIEQDKQDSTARVANFLLAISSLNSPEGRDPSVITDDITAGFVADRLQMSVDKLSAALLDLKNQGAVQDIPGGLRIVDAERLQMLADAA